MAQAQVEAVRRFYEASNRGDVDGAIQVFAQDAEWHQVTPVPDRAVHHGREEIQRFVRGLVDDFSIRVEMPMLLEAADHVAAVGRVVGATSAGLTIEFPLVHVWRFDGDVAVWVYDCSGPDRGP